MHESVELTRAGRRECKTLLQRERRRAQQARVHARRAQQFQDLEQAGARGTAGHRDTRRVNQRRGLDAALLREPAQDELERRGVNG